MAKITAKTGNQGGVCARVRFRFGSDGYVGYEGWYIDDINVTDDLASVDLDERDLEFVPSRFALHRPSPNPFSSEPTIQYGLPKQSHVMLEVFNRRANSATLALP